MHVHRLPLGVFEDVACCEARRRTVQTELALILVRT